MKINHLDHMLIEIFWLFIFSLPLAFYYYFMLEHTLGFWPTLILNEYVLSYFMTTPCFKLIGFLNQQWFTDVLKLIPYKHNYFVDSLGLQMMTRLIKHIQIVAMVTCLNGSQII
jgi:hypothetical protein